MTDLQSYRSYRDLPALAGLATIEDAAKPGLGVEACVTRLKRFHYAFLRLHEILTARITAEPIYELKSAFSHHAYLCAEHVSALRQRIGEMREPPLGLDEVPHEALQIAFDEILATPTTDALLLGLYAVAFRELDAALERYQRDTNPLTDAPSVRIIRFARLELDDILSFGQRALECVVSDEASARYGEWVGYLARLLQEAGFSPSPHGTPGQEGRGEGGLDTSQNREALACSFPSPPTPLPRSTEGEGRRRFSATPYVYDRIPKRDERFHDVWNQGVNAESFLYNPEMPAKPKTLMMLYKRLREIDVPEMMASIITETKGKPWDYYRDMSRQLWDEARHAMMGEVGFVALGVDWTKACITVNWSHRLNTECTPIERHAVLYFIEQGLMTKTGKRYEWEVGLESGLPLIATIQDFDWADEVLHAQLGRQWYIPAIGDWKTALAYGDECWSRILSNWHAVKEQGLTQHANWWPSVYREACVAWGEKPEATVLAFAETYEGARADLKNVMGSA